MGLVNMPSEIQHNALGDLPDIVQRFAAIVAEKRHWPVRGVDRGTLLLPCPFDSHHQVSVWEAHTGGVQVRCASGCFPVEILRQYGFGGADVERYAASIREMEVRKRAEQKRIGREADALLRQEERGGEPDSWLPVDLTPYLDGTIQPATTTLGLARDDGVRFLYPEHEHVVMGEMESGKSWLLVACTAVELNAGHSVLYVHFEEASPADTIGRLLAMGVTDATIKELFRFVGPNSPVTTEALMRLMSRRPTLVILDGVNEAMAMHGWNTNEVEGAAAFRQHLVMPCLRAGAATLAADHVTKDRDARGRHQIGSIHKANGLNGVLMVLENVEPFGRNRKGRSGLYVTKDRPAQLRQHGQPTKLTGKTFMGTLIVDDTRQWVPWTDVTIIAPKDEETAETIGDEKATDRAADDEHVFAVVVAILAKGAEANMRAIRGKAGLSNTRTADALARLVLDDRLTERAGTNRARLFSLPEGGSGSHDHHGEE